MTRPRREGNEIDRGNRNARVREEDFLERGIASDLSRARLTGQLHSHSRFTSRRQSNFSPLRAAFRNEVEDALLCRLLWAGNAIITGKFCGAPHRARYNRASKAILFTLCLEFARLRSRASFR